MIDINDTLNSVNSILRCLLSCNMIADYNYSIRRNNLIEREDCTGITYLLKKSSYIELCCRIEKKRDFTYQFLDGGLIQISYKYCSKGKVIQSHRLAYYPTFNSEQIGTMELGEFEEINYGMRNITDISYKEILSVPIRFDYDSDIKLFQERKHSYSHMTIGSYKNCRITLDKPATPHQFINFILRAFYMEKYEEYSLDQTLLNKNSFPATITDKELDTCYLSL